MSLVPDRPAGFSLRLNGYDYAQAGYYYVTTCTHERQCFFGDVVENTARLNDIGQTVQSVWNDLPRRFPGIALDEYIIMPNHVHGIIILSGESETDKPAPKLGCVIQAFKAVSTRLIRMFYVAEFVWQDDFYDHIIRGPRDLDRIRQYVVDNPVRWSVKREEQW